MEACGRLGLLLFLCRGGFEGLGCDWGDAGGHLAWASWSHTADTELCHPPPPPCRRVLEQRVTQVHYRVESCSSHNLNLELVFVILCVT